MTRPKVKALKKALGSFGSARVGKARAGSSTVFLRKHRRPTVIAVAVLAGV